MQSPAFLLARIAWLCVLVTVSSAQSGTQTPCVGFVNVAIEPSPDGQTYAVTQLSCPLEPAIVITGAEAARINGVTTNSLSCSDAGWLPGELTTAPFYAKISGGPASGRIIPITANTESSLTLDTGGASLASLGVSTGNHVEIVAGQTLLNLIGGPDDGVVGGTFADFTANAVDKILVNDALGVMRFYYYDTDASQWRRAGSNANQDGLRIPPQAGLAYYRISTQARAFLFVGGVPNTPSQLPVSPAGTSILAAYFPIPTTLDSLGIEDLSTWRKLGDPGVALESADRLLAEDRFGILRSYYHDGFAWRRPGSPADQGSTPIAPGSAIYSTRFGGGTPETWTRPIPYTLD